MQTDEAKQSNATGDDAVRPVNGLTNGTGGAEMLEIAAGTEMHASTLDWDANVVPTLEPADVQTWSEGRATLIPGRPDFLMSYATLPGQSAYRDREIGSLYVTELCKCLRLGDEMDRALKLVSKGVAATLMERDIEDHDSRFQLPFHLTSGMDKLIRL